MQLLTRPPKKTSIPMENVCSKLFAIVRCVCVLTVLILPLEYIIYNDFWGLTESPFAWWAALRFIQWQILLNVLAICWARCVEPGGVTSARLVLEKPLLLLFEKRCELILAIYVYIGTAIGISFVLGQHQKQEKALHHDDENYTSTGVAQLFSDVVVGYFYLFTSIFITRRAPSWADLFHYTSTIWLFINIIGSFLDVLGQFVRLACVDEDDELFNHVAPQDRTFKSRLIALMGSGSWLRQLSNFIVPFFDYQKRSTTDGSFEV
ncbi:unnamed protein product, partial [Mesorhabditis spiculigera]